MTTAIEFEKTRTCLYILGVSFARKGKYFVKVGTSKNVKARITDLQTGCPEKIRPLAACKIPAKGAVKREKELHRTLKDYQTNGEWFLLCDESYRLMSEYFLNILKEEEYASMVVFERRPYRRGFEMFPDHSDYINEPKVKINNLTGRPQMYQEKKPVFELFKHAIAQYGEFYAYRKS